MNLRTNIIAGLLVGLAASLSAPAHAEERVKEDSETVTYKGGPSRAMMFSGIATFGVSYLPALYVGSTSDRTADQRLVVPLVGPWLALGDRGDCGGTTGRSCDTETTYKVLIVVDGIFQSLGVLTFVGAFLNPETHTEKHRTVANKVAVLPAKVGGGYGLSLSGTFQ